MTHIEDEDVGDMMLMFIKVISVDKEISTSFELYSGYLLFYHSDWEKIGDPDKVQTMLKLQYDK